MSRRFRLSVVLRLRQLEEDAAQARLGAAIVQHLAAVAAREVLEGRLMAEHVWLRQLQGASASAGELQVAVRAVGGAEAARDVAQQHVGAAERAVTEARAQLAFATRRREVVERLRDRHVAAERRRDEHAEIVRLADVAAIQHLWNAREAGR